MYFTQTVAHMRASAVFHRSAGKGVAELLFGDLTKYQAEDWQNVLPQVLHRLQNKEKPMQNNFYSPVRVTQNDFRVQHCKV